VNNETDNNKHRYQQQQPKHGSSNIGPEPELAEVTGVWGNKGPNEGWMLG
jgi:hypothetical protein